MEKEKYYTPTIEELNVNQEVYLLDTGNYKASYSEGDVYPMLVTITQLTDYPTVWVKTKGNEKGYKVYEVYPEQIGLKYLDREDIESFGFESKHISSVGSSYFELKDFVLSINLDSGISHICKKVSNEYENHGNHYVLFKGTIKNKSEFSRLLKQLSII